MELDKVNLSKKLQQLELQIKLYGLDKLNKYKQHTNEYKEYKEFRNFVKFSIVNCNSNYYIIDDVLNKVIHDLYINYN
jgi:hypothetical protein